MAKIGDLSFPSSSTVDAEVFDLWAASDPEVVAAISHSTAKI